MVRSHSPSRRSRSPRSPCSGYRRDRWHSSRSRSPPSHSHYSYQQSKGSREGSRHRGRHRHHHHGRHERSQLHDRSQHEYSLRPVGAPLPFGARSLWKRDLDWYRPLFAVYLDVQKRLDIESLNERELIGRWKSFIGKWNRGELVEGWYDPEILEKARSRAQQPAPPSSDNGFVMHGRHSKLIEEHGKDEDEEDAYGPRLPSNVFVAGQGLTWSKSGPTIPSIDDLQIKRELDRSDALARNKTEHAIACHERKAHKGRLRDFEEEVAPRAEPGTRERRLEKKKDIAASNKAFAEARGGGSPGPEAGDEELMGGANGGEDLAAMKREREREERKKNERTLRREENLRARAAEREERLKMYRRKEEETMGVFKELAKQRFG